MVILAVVVGLVFYRRRTRSNNPAEASKMSKSADSPELKVVQVASRMSTGVCVLKRVGWGGGDMSMTVCGTSLDWEPLVGKDHHPSSLHYYFETLSIQLTRKTMLLMAWVP